MGADLHEVGPDCESAMFSVSSKDRMVKKRLILCLDGTWMNSDSGGKKDLFSKKVTLQVPSNVTRISRCFKRRCSDGRLQIINYESGVGTGRNFLDSITGGAFGQGLSERVREAYSYICANYMDGDEIYLIGFSRGAFTARSVAGLITNLGLLTRDGVEHFYNIFTDMQHWMDDDYEDEFPNVPFSDKPKGPHAAEEYRARLEKMGYTRVTEADGKLIKVKGVCVWDTVGSLGIPSVSWLDKIGIRPSNDDTYKWHNTTLSNRIEHAFHALALDESRSPFSPALWERPPEDKGTDLRQVWFPGNHGNCGGGWPDQGLANCSLAWMMDQMASVGVEFDRPSLDRVFKQSVEYYKEANEKEQAKAKAKMAARKKNPLFWAVNPIFENNHPQRPWGLGQICEQGGLMTWLSGKTKRTPGQYKQRDAKTKKRKIDFLEDTNERVHSTVRVRKVCNGLDLNDGGVWKCPSLKDWRLKFVKDEFHDPVPRHPDWEPEELEESSVDHPNNEAIKKRWVWEYVGQETEGHPDEKQRTMIEEPLGPYERYLLRLSGGSPNVYLYAADKEEIE